MEQQEKVIEVEEVKEKKSISEWIDEHPEVFVGGVAVLALTAGLLLGRNMGMKEMRNKIKRIPKKPFLEPGANFTCRWQGHDVTTLDIPEELRQIGVEFLERTVEGNAIGEAVAITANDIPKMAEEVLKRSTCGDDLFYILMATGKYGGANCQDSYGNSFT